MFGRADVRQFEQHYGFLREQEQSEEAERRFRMRCLRCVLRRHELEEAGEDLEEYDLSDEEQEVFGTEHQSQLAQLKLTPPSRIYEELDQLKRASQLYVSKTKDASVKERQLRAKKELMKKEVGEVKAGRKSTLFFPKRAEVKRAVLASTYDRLNESGGKAAVERYLIRKKKK